MKNDNTESKYGYGTFISDDGHNIYVNDYYYRVAPQDVSGPTMWKWAGWQWQHDDHAPPRVRRYKFKSSAFLDFYLNMKQYENKEDFAKDMKEVKELIENEIKTLSNGKESRV